MSTRQPTLDDRIRWLIYSANEEGISHAKGDVGREEHYHDRALFEAAKIRELVAKSGVAPEGL